MPWNNQFAVAAVAIDFVLYSINHDAYTYVQALFKLESTGNMQCELFSRSIRIGLYHDVGFVFLFVGFLMFNVFQTYQLLKDIHI